MAAPLPDVLEAVSAVSRVLDLLGVLANAVLGGVVARSHRFDPIGFAALAIVSGLGGGLIRDTLLQRGTPVALTDPAYVVVALVGAGVAFLLPVEGRPWQLLFPWVDALALGCWAAAGANKSLAVGLGWLPAVLLGTITAVGGGAVRDIVLRRVPTVFGGNTLYATSALVASGLLVALNELGRPTVALIAATLVGAGLTLLAQRRGWYLPSAYELPSGRAGRARVLPRPRWRRRTGGEGSRHQRPDPPPG